jgi:hypothetical protein
MERIRANTSFRDIRGPYVYIWRRFFGELPVEAFGISTSDFGWKPAEVG